MPDADLLTEEHRETDPPQPQALELTPTQLHVVAISSVDPLAANVATSKPSAFGVAPDAPTTVKVTPSEHYAVAAIPAVPLRVIPGDRRAREIAPGEPPPLEITPNLFGASRGAPQITRPAESASKDADPATNPAVRTLMLGKAWFPTEVGGLDRYYRDLLEHLPAASGIVIGSSAGAPERVTGVSGHEQPLAQRLLAFWRAAQRAADRADVVDAHFALYAVAPLLLGGLRRKPVVLHFHGPWADECVAAGDRTALRAAVRRLLERAAYRRADEAIVLTSAFRQVLVERYGLRPWDIHVEPPGVDLARFTPGPSEAARRRLAVEPEAFVAVAVRRLVSRMGLEVLLEAWAAAVASLPPGSTLLVVGDGPLRPALTAAVAERGISESVRLLGRVEDEQLVELYQAADVAVVPTIEHEGFGLVVIEAAACGTPSIVTDVGGLPEAIGSLDESLIVPAGDRDALRERLLRAQFDRPSRAATRAHAERFAWPAVAARHDDILARVATRHAHSNGAGSAASTVGRVASASGTNGPLKVVYLDHVARLSGGEIALLRLLPHLDRVSPHVVLAEDGPLVGKLHLAGISTEVLPMGDTARDLRKANVQCDGISAAVAGAAVAYVVRLAARLRQLQPDLVHTNSLKSGVYGALAARLAGIPVIWHMRDRLAEDYLPRSAIRLVRRMSRHLAAAVIANSQSTLDTLATSGKSSTIYSVLPDLLNAAPARDRATQRDLAFGIVGRLAPWKGQDLFLRAFARAFPEGEERAVVVGEALFGEDEYAHGLSGLAESLGIAPRLELRGYRPDVWGELARLDVLVHASITPEPFGQVILEGMAAGVPVIAAGAGGPAEILKHDVTGVLYEPKDIHELAGAMRRMRDPRLRDRLSGAARGELEPYSAAVVGRDLQLLYAKVAARARH